MERKDFIKHAFSTLGIIAIAPIIPSCSKSDGSLSQTGDTKGGPGGNGSGSASSVTADASCAVTPTETEGPYPTHSPASYLRSDIRKGDGVGATLTSTLTVVNVKDNCSPLENVYVDIWHCDAMGNYSEYNSYTSVHWLRGRQLTDAKGQVKFISIFPGWYQGRATHIHVHVFDQSGNSLLVTQIAFPDDLCSTVNTDGASYGYTKGMTGYTYNNADDILNDSLTKEISTVTGSLANGFDLSFTVHVNA